jgi:hypothetical protein
VSIVPTDDQRTAGISTLSDSGQTSRQENANPLEGDSFPLSREWYPIDHELLQLIKAWGHLPESVRKAALAFVKASADI